MKHPYKEYETSKLWKIVKSSIEELVENNDIDFYSDRVCCGLYLQKYTFS